MLSDLHSTNYLNISVYGPLMCTPHYHCMPPMFICLAYDFCSMVFQMLPSIGEVRFPVIGLIYSCIASAWMGFSWSRWIISRKARLITLLGCFSTLLVTHLPLLLTLLHTLEDMSHVILTLILDYFILLFYIVADHGIVKGINKCSDQTQVCPKIV